MYLVGVVDEAIQDGIGQGRIIDEFMPVIDRELAGNQGGVHTVAVVQQFEYIPPVFVLEPGAVLIGQIIPVSDHAVEFGTGGAHFQTIQTGGVSRCRHGLSPSVSGATCCVPCPISLRSTLPAWRTVPQCYEPSQAVGVSARIRAPAQRPRVLSGQNLPGTWGENHTGDR